MLQSSILFHILKTLIAYEQSWTFENSIFTLEVLRLYPFQSFRKAWIYVFGSMC